MSPSSSLLMMQVHGSVWLVKVAHSGGKKIDQQPRRMILL
jgi:hypothetical protein